MTSANYKQTVILITGAASGIGRELALQAARGGYYVIATDIDYEQLQESRNLVRRQGGELEIHPLDVSDMHAVETLAEQLIAELQGRKLILINNAGQGLFSGRFQFTPLQDFQQLLNVNLMGTVHMTKAFYNYFLCHNTGHIVNISSLFGLGGFANQSAYCTSKFAVRGFTESLRAELQGTGILTTCVFPGGIKTNIVRNSKPVGEYATAQMYRESVARFDQMAKTSPEKAAGQILKAIRKKKTHLLIGPDAKAAAWLIRLFPKAYSKIVNTLAEKTFRDPFKMKGKEKALH